MTTTPVKRALCASLLLVIALSAAASSTTPIKPDYSQVVFEPLPLLPTPTTWVVARSSVTYDDIPRPHAVQSLPQTHPQKPKHHKPKPKPKPAVVVRLNPPARVIGDRLAGTSTHYFYHQGAAAAGWALRRMLGRNWRYSWVEVCIRGYKDHKGCLIVHLTDYMASTNHSKVIDLDDRDFGTLAGAAGQSFGVGVLRVSIREVKR